MTQPSSLVLKPGIAISSILLAVATSAPGKDPIDYARDVRPILEAHCHDCHGPERQESGLRLDVRDSALGGGESHAPNIVPGDAGASLLIRLVRGDEEGVRMPKRGAALSADDIATLAAWVDQGAVWPEGVDGVALEEPAEHWSFKPLATFPGGNSIDTFIAATLEENGLEMSPEADRVAWLRRVFLDLTGLPPTPEQIAALGSATRETIVDRLLASPRHGERWAQHWLDVVRYADTDGFEVNTPRPNAWPYRDYVIEAFNSDTPYDQFIREQLAGDRLGKDAATGFLVTAAALLPGQIGKDAASMRLARQDELGEIVINTSEAFLGLSVGCARCHDHKFDAISARDYYSMQAFFAGVTYGERPIRSSEAEARRKQAQRLEARASEIDRTLAGFVPMAQSGVMRPPVNARLNIERFAPVETRRVRLAIRSTNKLEACIDELEVFDAAGRNVALALAGTKWSASGSTVTPDRHQPEFINDGEYGNSRSWMCNATEGWIALEFPVQHTIERIAWGRDREGEFNDRLAIDYAIEIEDVSGNWRVVAGSSDRHPGAVQDPGVPIGLNAGETAQATALHAEKERLEAAIASLRSAEQAVFGGTFGAPQPMHLLHRGDPEQPKDEVPAAVPAALGDLALARDAPEHDRRLALANWIASPENPLTARVMVNRIWQGHFGIGLVETSNDFGRAGARPSHPGLLDWLAAEFIRSGWSVKHMHRLIVLSATYRQSAKVVPGAHAKDADVRLLWRFPSRRLEAESLRDSILAVSGLLNLQAGGPGFDLFTSRGGLSGFPPVESFTADGHRRMVYAHKIRMEPDAVFGAFDCPDAGQSVSRRRQSTTPIQALNLFNSPFTIDAAQAFACRIREEAGTEVTAQVARAHWLALGRAPDAGEAEEAAAAVRAHGLATLCRVLVNSNEFLFIP